MGTIATMKIKTVETILTTNTAGQVVESIPVLPSEDPVQRADGTWVDPIEMVEDDLGVPIRIVDEAVVLNSVGQPVAAIPGRGLGPSIQLSNASVPEDAAIGALIGTLSVANGSGSYTFTITADPDSKFEIDGDALEVNGAFDYDVATSHQVTIEADNGVDDPISRTFTISVTQAGATVSLAWSGDEEDITADLTATITGWEEGDILEWQLDDDPAFTTPDESDQGPVTESPVTVETEALADGTYYARARVVRGLTEYAWSNTVTITIDTPLITFDSSLITFDSTAYTMDSGA